MRLQNIRFPEADICREEELYFHRNGADLDAGLAREMEG